MSRVHIEVPSPSGRDGKFIVDGQDIAKEVSGFTLTHTPGHFPRLSLSLRVLNVTTLAAEHVQVHLAHDTAALLERAGWTPPPGVESVLERDEAGCPCDKVMWRGRPETARVLGRTVPTCPVHGVNAQKATEA